ncbi:MAG: carbohydrate ABC transporter permease, partial [Lachnospiraceae bacterium]|nr:carbohydrate ABC transporter permease [Lachnospiraceae bacterium]
MSVKTETKKYSSKSRNALIAKIVLYLILIIITIIMVIPFLWMLSASIKSDREVFMMNPFVWIPEVPR